MAPNELAQVPMLGGEYALTPEQVQDFQRDGHVLLRGVVSPAEMAAYRPLLAEVVDRYDLERQAMEKAVSRQRLASAGLSGDVDAPGCVHG